MRFSGLHQASHWSHIRWLICPERSDINLAHLVPWRRVVLLLRWTTCKCFYAALQWDVVRTTLFVCVCVCRRVRVWSRPSTSVTAEGTVLKDVKRVTTHMTPVTLKEIVLELEGLNTAARENSCQFISELGGEGFWTVLPRWSVFYVLYILYMFTSSCK